MSNILGLDIGESIPIIGLLSTFLSLLAATIATLWQKKLSGKIPLPICNFYQAIGASIFLFFAMLIAMSFVFGQIPITDTILSRYVPDELRAKALSLKFMLNLVVGATVLPICGILLQSGMMMNSLFIILSCISALVVVSGVILPVQIAADRQDQ